jgi:N-acetylglucosaminyltransferase
MICVTVLYVSVTISYGVAQGRYARRYLTTRTTPAVSRWPSVDVILPCYNEDPEILARCCESVARLTYAGELRVFLVDDGSSNFRALDMIYAYYRRQQNWTVIRARRSGKREAQATAISRGAGELVVTIDSDTVLASDALRQIVPALANPHVGAVTGDVRVLNRDQNRLTALLEERYRLLFRQERAAQSQVHAVLCCSGPFSAYRRAVVAQVLDHYRDQRFMGRPCLTGDDIHLTNLVLAQGYRSLYEPSAVAWTIVPSTLRSYARQQIRWNRSFYRELLPTTRVIWRQSPYLLLDVAARLFLPLLLAAGLALTAAGVAGGSSVHGLLMPGLLAIIGVASGGLLTIKSTQPKHQFVLWYGLIYVLLLIPIRLWSLATLPKNGWETRGKPSQFTAEQFVSSTAEEPA